MAEEAVGAKKERKKEFKLRKSSKRRAKMRERGRERSGKAKKIIRSSKEVNIYPI